MLKRLKLKLLALAHRRRIDGEVDEELRYHLEKAIEQNVSRGMTPQEAKRAAVLGFGGIDQIKEASRDARGVRLFEEVIQDLRYGIRVLGRAPGFTLVVILMLGLGVGANTAIFSLADKLLLRSLPVSHPEQLVKISAESVNPKFLNTIFSYPDYVDYRNQNQVFDGLVAHTERTLPLGDSNSEKRIWVSTVSSNYFQVLGAAIRGRGFLPEEESTEDSRPVAVISYGLWASLASDPKFIGKPIMLDGRTYTVVGIASKEFRGVDLEYPVDVWIPLSMYHALLPGSVARQNRRFSWLALMGRMKPGLDIRQAQAGLETSAQGVFQANTPTADRNLPFNERHIILDPGGKGSSVLRTSLGPALKLMAALATVLLLIACANVAGLLLARATTQRREIAIRLALGAGRGRLIRMSLVQSAILTLLGAGLGVLLAPWLHGLLLSFQPGVDVTGTAIETSLDLRVLGFALALAVFCGLLFGIAPALQSTSSGVTPSLKGSSQPIVQGPTRLSLRSALMIGQIALTMLMLVGSALLVRTLRNLLSIDPGFKPSNVAVFPIGLKEGKPEEAYEDFYERLTERLKGVNGISGVARASLVPLTGGVFSTSIYIEGRQSSPGVNQSVDCNQVGPRYHELMGIQIVQGRRFTDQDRMGAQPVTIVNESFARTFYSGENPVGKRISLGTNGKWIEIVGVARDVKAFNLASAAVPHIDLPMLQRRVGSGSQVLVRSDMKLSALAPLVQGIVRELDPSAVIEPPKSMTQIVLDSIASARMASTLTSLLGLVALLVTTVGLYGLMTYSVSQQTREIGIRMALGASRSRVLASTLMRGAALTGLGIALGTAGAIATTRLIRALLYEVRPGDFASFVIAAFAIGLIGLLACYFPARRAAKGDPMTALRCE